MKIFFSAVLISIQMLCGAQDVDIQVNAESKPDNSVSFSYSSKEPGHHYIYLEFSNLSNTSGRDFGGSVNGLTGNLFSLRPLDKEKGISYSYKYYFCRGDIRAKPDSSFAYLLPVSRSKSISAQRLSYIGDYTGHSAPKGWAAYALMLAEGDTIYASRKGVVVSVEDDHTTSNVSSYSFNRSVNSVVVEHEDGTYAKYSGFKEGEIFIKVGQSIIPRQPLGIIGNYNEQGAQLRFSIFYLEDFDKLERIGVYGYINPNFKTKEGVVQLSSEQKYTPAYNEEDITKEFSRRELKSYLKSKGK